MQYEKFHLYNEYEQLLSAAHYTPEEWENIYLGKSTKSDNETFSLLSLPLEEIGDRLHVLEKQLHKNPFPFPLHPDIPKVSDLLAWWVTHPCIVETNPVTQEKQPFLSLESLAYSVVKRPDPTKPSEKYLAKVDLEFRAESPKRARSFHDSLIQPNDMVDPKYEVKWSSQKGRYKTSFFLKDRTRYIQGTKK